jgi:hypothetical protein
MSNGFVTAGPRLILRLEGAAVFAASLLLYREFGGGWLLFAGCFLIPDLAMLGYLGGPRAGSVAYNAAHSYLGPLALWLLTRGLSAPWAIWSVLVWTAHIGFDRMVGYGLKYPSAFGATHLGPVGAARTPAPDAA